MSNIYTVILAAGKSTRYKGRKSKLLEDLGGLPIILHIHDIAKKVSGKNIIIVCNKKNINDFKKIITNSKFVVQEKQNGTADAILSAKTHIKGKDFLILFGDTPLISIKSIRHLCS